VEISVVIPVYNEKENIETVWQELQQVLSGMGRTFEVVLVDDGSKDGSCEIIKNLAQQYAEVKGILFRRNFGQTAALAAGFQYAGGRLIIPMDADGQNDPHDIPRMIQLGEEKGYDVVSGWRHKRQDKWLRSFLSRLANSLISWISGVALHDYGCTLKVYRAEILKDVRLYGEMHRLIPIFAHWAGGTVTEMTVNHRPRHKGTSKYGLNRTFKVMIDLITAKFLSTYLAKPAYVFSFFGLFLFLFASLTLGFTVVRRLFWHGEWLSPVLFVGLGSLGLSIVLVLMGILAELIVRVYFESQNKRPYLIKEICERKP
jgi:glycosyltransferase involved in cell wall biosynthesis